MKDILKIDEIKNILRKHNIKIKELKELTEILLYNEEDAIKAVELLKNNEFRVRNEKCKLIFTKKTLNEETTSVDIGSDVVIKFKPSKIKKEEKEYNINTKISDLYKNILKRNG